MLFIIVLQCHEFVLFWFFFVEISDPNLEAGGNFKFVPAFKDNALLMKTDPLHDFGVL